ncbi:MAG: 16S rRNA (cytidine(1402)-2'-O)-methyltransferase [Candidatus Tritonobacter lacicola]|nr:16S rRNA (cytidine(1402)-2'-O)-methyltransferase [Candidatus Tritonobacter lacicola]
MAGILYIVGTPIGNMEDMTLRAIRVLGEVDLVAAEDTRVARKLLSKYGIQARLLSCHDANEKKRAAELIGRLKGGSKVAITSDAGMPGLSDPGYRLIRCAIDEGIRVEVVPGPSAVVSALAVSGLPAHNFVFRGFPPRGEAAKRKVLAGMLFEDKTSIFFEAPGRLLSTLEIIRDVLGPGRNVVICRELTKLNEEVIRGSVSDVLEQVGKERVRGEVVLLVGGVDGSDTWRKLDPAEHLRMVEEELSIERMEAIKLVARMRGVARDAVYKIALKKKDKCI